MKQAIIKALLVLVLMAMSHAVGRYYCNVYVFWLGYETGYHAGISEAHATIKSGGRIVEVRP